MLSAYVLIATGRKVPKYSELDETYKALVSFYTSNDQLRDFISDPFPLEGPFRILNDSFDYILK